MAYKAMIIMYKAKKVKKPTQICKKSTMYLVKEIPIFRGFTVQYRYFRFFYRMYQFLRAMGCRAYKRVKEGVESYEGKLLLPLDFPSQKKGTKKSR